MNKIRPTSPPATTAEEAEQRTLLLIRRVLCAHAAPTTPLEDLLPALTSSREINIQLYAFVAIIARDFVLSWYSDISNDHAFVDEIVALIAHLTTSLEERVRCVDLEVLLLDEVPAIVDQHVGGMSRRGSWGLTGGYFFVNVRCWRCVDYRRAVERQDTALAPHLTLPEIFRSYQPHPAITGSPDSTRLYMKLLSNGILSVLLPPEDLESNCERSLLREIVSSLVFGNVLEKLSEPFMIHEIIVTLVRQLRPDLVPPPEPAPAPTFRRGSVKPSQKATPPPPDPPRKPRSALDRTLDLTFNILTKTFSAVYTLLSSLNEILLNPLPPRPKRRSLIRCAFPSAISTIFNLSTLQPWLPATLRLISRPFSSRASAAGALIDDLLVSKIAPHLESPKLVADMLRIARANLFPGNAMSPTRKYPSDREKGRIRANTERVLLDVVPETLRNVWWKGLDREAMEKEVGKNWLEVFSEKEINKVLIVRLLDLAVGRLLPELLESGGAEIRKQRTEMGEKEGVEDAAGEKTQ